MTDAKPDPLDSKCIKWHGYIAPTGYGRVGREHAHRRAWKDQVGPIPEGMMVLHKCGNRACVNIAHFGTAKDNAQDSIKDGTKFSPYRGRTHCKNGHEFTPENTGWKKESSRPYRSRYCLECHRKINRAWDRGTRERSA